MNDDFLRRARRPPPAAFAKQLRERLRQQDLAETWRNRPGWKLLTAAFIAGSALATATYLTMSHTSLLSSSPTQSTPTHSDTPSDVRSAAIRRNERNITINPQIGAQSALHAPSQSEHSTSDAPDGSQSPAAVSSSGTTTASGTHSPTYPGVWTTATPSLRILVTPDLTGIIKPSLTQLTTPAKLEAASADAALRALCTGEPEERPKIVITSRRIRPDETKFCNRRGEDGLSEATLGHVAVVVTRAKSGSPMQLSPDAVFRAIIKRFPAPGDPTRLVDNPYTHWNQIDPALEDRRIEVLGPARDSPEFTALLVALMEPACDKYSEIRALHDSDRSRYEQICHSVREDGAYIPGRFDSNFIQQRLWSDPGIVAVIDYSFYARNSADLLGSLLQGVAPTRESILDGSYVAARTLHLYVSQYRKPAVSVFVNDYLRWRLPWHPARLPPDLVIDDWGRSRPAELTEVKRN
jgi:phosphate transport system substrate-binding protein